MKYRLFNSAIAIPKAIRLLMIMALLLAFSSEAGKRILYIGDSITDGGWGNSGGSAKPSTERNQWDLNHIYGHSYMMLCAAHYQGEYPEKDYEFFNRGISGNTLADLESRWEEDAIEIKPDVLSILIGTNDVDQYLNSGKNSFDIADWERRYRKLLDASLAANPQLKIIICSPFTAKAGWVGEANNFCRREQLTDSLAKATERIARDYKALHLDYNGMFKALIGSETAVRNGYWIWDGIHPTPAGHQRMADLWIKSADEHKILF